MKLAVQLLLQESLEAEKHEVLEQDRYARGRDETCRNGYRHGRVESAEGWVDVQVPQVRGVPGYRSPLMQFLADHSEVLQRLVTEMYARGLATRDVEAAFTDATGHCLLTRDGAPGLLRALEEVFPRSLRIRCWVHKVRNVLGKLPESAREEVKAWLAAVRDAPTPEAGRQAAAETIAQFERQYPAAMKSFSDDLEASLTHLRVPPAHRKFVRTTNLIERSFEEQRRRTKVIPRFFDERSCLKPAFAALERAASRRQKVTITELQQRQLALLRNQLQPDPTTTDRQQELAA